MARVIMGEDHDWANTAMARRRAVTNSLRSAEVQERKRANQGRDQIAQRQRQAAEQKLANVGARFSKDTYDKLVSAIVRISGIGPGKEPTLWAALDPWRAQRIMSVKLYTGEPDRVAIHPKPEDAAHLAKVFRAFGVDGFCHALEHLEQLAGVPDRTDSGFRLHSAEFFAALRLVERHGQYQPRRVVGDRLNGPKPEDGTIYSGLGCLNGKQDPKRFEAAAILRKVVIRRGVPQLHPRPEEAVVLSEVLTPLGANRSLLSSIDRIAALAPAATA